MDEHKPFFLVKMCERWSQPHVRGQLGERTMYELWMPGEQMPTGLVARVLTRLEQARAGPDLQSPGGGHVAC